jgi:hypothetical protein
MLVPVEGAVAPGTSPPTVAHLLGCFLRLGKSRDKAVSLPNLAILEVYKSPRFLDCFSLVGTFDALDARKVSIIAKGIEAILVHELLSASCNAQAGALWVSQPPTPGAGPRSVMGWSVRLI